MIPKNYFENISFLATAEQNQIKALFITTSTAFLIDFKVLCAEKKIKTLRKKCHTFGSSLIVFNLEECGIILQKISNELKLKNFENACALFLDLETEVNAFIEHIKKP